MSSSGCCAGGNLLTLIGRLIIGALFLFSGIMKIQYWGGMLDVVAGVGLPYPEIFLGVATALEILGGLSVILGYKTRLGAWFLIIFLVATTYLFHSFWKADAAQADSIRDDFIRNVVYLGALFLLAGFGAGGYSFDAHHCNKDSCCK